MTTPDRKVRELMSEYEKTGVLRTAALRSVIPTANSNWGGIGQ